MVGVRALQKKQLLLGLVIGIKIIDDRLTEIFIFIPPSTLMGQNSFDLFGKLTLKEKVIQI